MKTTSGSRRPRLGVLFAPVLLLIAGCGGGGAGGRIPDPGTSTPTLDTAIEVHRIGAIMKSTLDFASVFLPIKEPYLSARAGVGAISCPNAGTFTVTSPATGHYAVTYSACGLTWTTLSGSIALQVNNSDLVVTGYDLTMGGVHYQGKLTLVGAAGTSPASGLSISADCANTLTPIGSPSYQFCSPMDLRTPNNGIYEFVPGVTIGQADGSAAMYLDGASGPGTTPAHVQAQSLDGAGNFVRVGVPTDGNPSYQRLSKTFWWSGDLVDSSMGFTISFYYNTTPNVANGSDTWSDALGSPHYDSIN